MRITPKPTGLAGNFYKRLGNGARLLTTWLLTASLCLPLGATARHRNQHGDSQPRACSSDALREACRAPMLLIQPVR